LTVVLATDIFDTELNGLRRARWEKAFKEEKTEETTPGEPQEQAQSLPASAERDDIDFNGLRATIVIEHIIQASDVSHTMQHWHVYRKVRRASQVILLLSSLVSVGH
jgi:hypothetical protein